jgi:hypothetical protein
MEKGTENEQKIKGFTPKGIRFAGLHSAEDVQDAVALAKIKREAALQRSGADMSFGADVSRVPLMYIDPMFDPILLMFPKENVRELNRRLRHYYSFHPIIKSCIDLHSSYALSDFELRCDDKAIERYYNELKEKIDLLRLLIQMNRDYFLLGEGFLYGNWDATNEEWFNFNQYPPENIEIHKTYVGPGIVYYLKPDDELKKVLNSPKEVDQAISNMIPDEFKEHIRSGKPYLLDNARLIHFANRPAEYAIRGESAVKTCLKDLLLEDKLRLLQYTFIDCASAPIKLWKLGSKEKGWIPPKRQRDEFERLLVQARNDPAFEIITHPFVEAEFLTVVDKKENLIPLFEFVQKRLLIGLFASDAMLGGEAAPYAGQALSTRVVMHRYLANRNAIENVVRKKVFLPVAIRRDFVRRTQAELAHNVRCFNPEREYVLPNFFWQKQNLLNNTAEQEMLLRLREKGEIPFEVICDTFGWEVDSLKEAFRKEQSTELDPLWRKVRETKAEKVEKVANQILDGVKVKDLTIPVENEKIEKGVAPGPGRPPLPVEELSKYEKVPISNKAVGPRIKQEEKGGLPKPIHEETTPA